MRRSSFLQMLLVLCGVALASLPSSATACAVCYGASDSPLAKGMNWGILTLLFVVVFVLSGIAAFGVYLARRAASVSASSIPTAAAIPELELTDKV
jgi:hypothetical protein